VAVYVVDDSLIFMNLRLSRPFRIHWWQNRPCGRFSRLQQNRPSRSRFCRQCIRGL